MDKTEAQLALERGADLRGIRKALERIADGLDLVAGLLVSPMAMTDAPATGCLHPEDRRVDYGMTNGRPDWQCRDCGFRSIAQPAGVGA